MKYAYTKTAIRISPISAIANFAFKNKKQNKKNDKTCQIKFKNI